MLNIRNHHRSYTESFSNFILRDQSFMKKRYDFQNLFFGKFCIASGGSSGGFHKTHSIGMRHIFDRRRPLKVSPDIIMLVAVFMINLWRLRQKCDSNKSMDQKCFFDAIIIREADLKVATFLVWRKYLAVSHATHPSVVANLIKRFVTGYLFPLFHIYEIYGSVTPSQEVPT